MDDGVDWKAVLFAVLDGVSEEEGVIFARSWKLTPDLKAYVVSEYEKHAQEPHYPTVGFKKA